MCEVRIILGGSEKQLRNHLVNNYSIAVLDLGSDSEDEQKFMNSRYILKVDPIGFDDELAMGTEGDMVER